MNKQGRKRRYESIGWTDWTWNPIKGMCPRACKLPDGKEYCYARDFYRRVLNEKYCGETEGKNLIFLDDTELCKPYSLKKPSKIFVCSTFELFHPTVKWMRNAIFTVIKENPRHTFQVLTKMPENIDRPMPHNVWLGVTITGIGDLNLYTFIDGLAKITFISYEPLLSKPKWDPHALLIFGVRFTHYTYDED